MSASKPAGVGASSGAASPAEGSGSEAAPSAIEDASSVPSASSIPSASSVALAERVRAALLERALAAHEDARLQGLCMDGAWEAAVSAMRRLDVAGLVRAGEDDDR